MMTLSKHFRDAFMPRLRAMIRDEAKRMTQKGGVINTNNGLKLCDDLANDRVSQWMKAAMEESSAAQSLPQAAAHKPGEHGITACISPMPSNLPTCEHRKRSHRPKASGHLASQTLRRLSQQSRRYHPKQFLKSQLKQRMINQRRFLRQFQSLRWRVSSR